MNTNTMKHATALGAAGALVAGAVAIATASPSWAAPVPTNTAALRIAASTQVTDVRYYRRHYYRHRYYGGYYRRRYGYPYWGYSYAYPYRYAYPYYYPYSYPFGFGWGGWWGW